MMLMFVGIIVLFFTGCVRIILVDARAPLSGKNRTNGMRVPEDCSVCGINTDCMHKMVRGGSAVTSSKIYPWMVSIRSDPDYNSCGGAIIDKFHILTAAHCVKDTELRCDVTVHFQTSSLKKMSRGIGIDKIIVHPKYDLKNSNSTGIVFAKYDIALVKLKEEIKCDEYKIPICLPEAGFKPPLGNENIIAGWGVDDTSKNPKRLPTLHHGITKLLDFAECIKAIPEATTIEDHVLCQGGTEQTPCYGDSGSPLMHKIKHKYYVVGVASAETHKSCSSKNPVMYTDVAKFLDWIEKEKKASLSFLKERKNHHKHKCRGRKNNQKIDAQVETERKLNGKQRIRILGK